jgi:uncharacterized protein (TIGR01319 family)
MSLLIADIGSTFTKARLFGADGAVRWSGQAPTRPADLHLTEQELRDAAAADHVQLPDGPITACSSAAGGLRLAVLGLTRTFTYDAALHAALGAGARIVGRFPGCLTDSDLSALSAAAPDVVLLTGGTDYGDQTAALDFARQLSCLDRRLSIVVACNRAAAGECRKVLERAGHAVVVVANVMPELGRTDFEPAREVIREIFLTNVIGRLASQQPHLFDVLAPTPAAVLTVTELLSEIAQRSVLVVDVGGATTDVHSALAAAPAASSGWQLAAVQQTMRTVEADLGLRESAPSLLAAAEVREATPPPPVPCDELTEDVARLSTAVDTVDSGRAQVDTWLAQVAAMIALERHAGQWVAQLTADGVKMRPIGRDLRGVDLVIGTGGVLSRDESALQSTLASADTRRLLPKNPATVSDRDYLLPTLGVLVRADPVLGRLAAKQALAALAVPADPAGSS